MSKTKKQMVPWLLIIPLIIILSFVSTVEAGFLSGIFAIGMSFGAYVGNFQAGATLVLVLFVLVSRIPALRRRIDPRLLSYIFAASMVTITYSCFNWPWNAVSGLGPLVRIAEPEAYGKYIPIYWTPEAGAWENLIAGSTAPLNWAEWAPSYVGWVLFPILMFFFILSWANLLHHRWLAVEELPIPFAAGPYEIVRNTYQPKGTPGRNWLMIGGIIGFLFYMPYVLTNLFRWFPDIYGWTTDPPFCVWAPGSLEITEAMPAIARLIPGLVCANVNPIWVAILYFAPLSVLFSWWFCWLVLVVLGVQIFYALGYYTGTMEGVGEGWGFWTRGDVIYSEAPMKLGAFGNFGVLPGIVIFYLFLNRHYIASTIKAALENRGPSELEAQPLSHRSNYILMIVSAILLVMVMAIMGMGHVAPFALFVYWITYLGWMRVYANIGVLPMSNQTGNAWFKVIWPTMTEEIKTAEFTFTVGLVNTTAGWEGSGGFYNSVSDTLAGYGFGRSAEANPRNIFLVMAVAGILGPIIGYTTMIWLSSQVGFNTLPFPHDWNWFSLGSPEAYHAGMFTGGPSTWVPQALAGFIVTGIFTFLRMRFAWWPIDPIGLLMATNLCECIGYPGLALSPLVAWILKILTIRVRGATAYNQYGKPLAGGFIAGYALSIVLLGGPLSIYKFFYPG